MKTISIKACGLGKRYDIYDRPWDRLWSLLRGNHSRGRPFWALQDVSFECKQGETIGIIGRNGSGKSTLLQIICSTLDPTVGVVEVNGRIAALLELGAGFNSEFTGRENARLNAAILGLKREEIAERMPAIIEFAEIGDFIDQPVKYYSSGMFLRLAFAVIAHVDADILVVDEALAVGDVMFVQKCMRFLRSFRNNGILLFVSHDPGMVTSLCDRAMWLDLGRIQYQGPAAEVTEAYIEHVYAQKQSAGSKQTGTTAALAKRKTTVALPPDIRRERLRASNLRNDLQVFSYSREIPGFGTGRAQVIEVRFVDDQSENLAVIEGGERVTVEVHWQALERIEQPIVGFLIKDRLGQFLFGDNSYLSTQHAPLPINAGEHAVARFTFRMPYLPKGDYAITVALAEGTQDEHIQHQWVHEAVLLRSESSHVSGGLIGLPMEQIELKIVSDYAQA